MAAKSASPIGAWVRLAGVPGDAAARHFRLGGGRPALPPGFDLVSFERAAKMIFVRLQAANDRGDVEDLREFSTLEMFAAFRVDLQDRGPSGQHTEGQARRGRGGLGGGRRQADRQRALPRRHPGRRCGRGGAVRRGVAPGAAGRRQPLVGDRRHSADRSHRPLSSGIARAKGSPGVFCVGFCGVLNTCSVMEGTNLRAWVAMSVTSTVPLSS